MSNCVGIINLDENEKRMDELVRNRPLASVPIAAKYRIVDFVLSNMTNSGIECIGIFTKNKSRSLMDHLTNGRPWDLHRKKDGLKVFNFGDEEPFVNDVDNFYDNIEFIKNSRKDYVLLAPSYMICNIDYREALTHHINNKNDITVIYKDINNANKSFLGCDVVNVEEGKVKSIGKNVGEDNLASISMEMYIMPTYLFIDIVNECVKRGSYKKIKSFIHDNLDRLNVGSYKFNGYLSCINSLTSYYYTNMDLLKRKVSKELFYNGGTIYTKAKDEAPTRYTRDSKVTNSIIANGCYIEGEVRNSIISRCVYVGKDVTIDGCVILQDVVIGEKAKLERIIVDKGTQILEDKNYVGSKSWPVVMKKRQYI